MRRTGSLLTSFLIGLVGLIALPVLGAGSARADTVTPITQLTNFHQVVVDSADGYVFLSEGVSSGSWFNGTFDANGIVVTDLTGNYVATLDAGDGAEGIALDGGTLYAALGGAAAVAAIDISAITPTTTTPTQTLYPLTAGYVPYDVAVQGGKVWVSYNSSTTFAGSGAIGAINLAAATPAAAFEPTATLSPWSDWWSAPEITADPGDNGVLAAIQEGQSLTVSATFNTTTDPATTLSTQWLGGDYSSATSCYGGDDIGVLPGGAQLVSACSGLASDYVYGVNDVVTPATKYATGPGPDAVAIAPSGMVAAGVSGKFATTTAPSAIYVYRPGGQLLNVIALGTTAVMADRGLAWSADGSRLYAVLATTVTDPSTLRSTTTYSLRVIDDPTVTNSALTLSAPSSVNITKGVALTGKLTLANGAPVPAGTQVAITRTLGTAVKTFAVAVASNGSFSLTDTSASTLGAYTYRASYAGVAGSINPASATRTVQVIRFSAPLTLNAGATTITYGTTSTVTAHLGPTYQGRYVTIYAAPANHPKAVIKRGNVDSHGNLTVTYRATYTTTFSATFSGDPHYAPATVSQGVRVRVAVGESVGGYYGTARSGSTTYRLYHHTATLGVSVAVSPGKPGHCVKLEIWENDGAGWYFGSETGCGYLNGSSKVSGRFSLAQAAAPGGVHYRIRADYDAGTDKSDLPNDSAWQYFIVYP